MGEGFPQTLQHDIPPAIIDPRPPRPLELSLEDEPFLNEKTELYKAMPNWKAVKPDGLPAQILTSIAPNASSASTTLHVGITEEVSQQWEDAKVLHNKKDAQIANTTGGFRLLLTEAECFLKIIASHLWKYCKDRGILPKERCGFRPARSPVDVLCYSSRVTNARTPTIEKHSLAKRASLTCRRRKTLMTGGSCDRHTVVLTYFGLPAKMLTVIRQFLDRMRACVRTADGEHS